MNTGTQQPALLSPLTQEDLGQLQVHLPTLKIVSYRGPGQSGGVVSSLGPLSKQLGTSVHWIALSGLPEPQDESHGAFAFHSPDLPSAKLSTQGRAIHEYLWPLLHGLTDKAHFDIEAWRSFRSLSQVLANHALGVASHSIPTLVWLHDFEMVLASPLLSMDAGVIVSHFWHAPWPAAEIMAQSPIAVEMIEAVLSNQVLGFHTLIYAQNFLESVKKIISQAQVDVTAMTVTYKGRTTKVVAMPLGIDFQYWQRLARSSRVESESIPVRHRLAQQVILGVDRFDYTKGILEKLAGLESFLIHYPEWSRRFHYVQLAQIGEIKSAEFASYRQAVHNAVARINGQYRSDGWEPIMLLEGDMSQLDLAAWYQAADVLAITPLADGLNLIPKEYAACRLDEQGSIVLSDKAGVSAELMGGALLVNPTSALEIADAVSAALSMGVEEKRRRMVAMRHVVGWNRLHDWACGFLRHAMNIRPTT